MVVYLLTFNPKRWNWSDFEKECAAVERGMAATREWSCGNSRSVVQGSQFFMIRLGEAPKGIIGTGEIVSPSYEDNHWDKERRRRGEKCRFVKIQFEILNREPIIGWDELEKPPLKGFRWASQASGIKIPSPYAEELKALWSRVVGPRIAARRKISIS
jgi:5-methylcytosine-specific restriction enzyme A